MAKKQKKLFVWQKAEPKIRKQRQRKQKQKDPEEQIYETPNQKDSADHIQEPIEIAAQMNGVPQQTSHQPNQGSMEAMQIEQNRQIQANYLLQRERRNQLFQKLKTVKQIFYVEDELITTDPSKVNLDQYRAFECNQIRSFLNKVPDEMDQTSNDADIYGTPGTGKTFTVKTMLKQEGLFHRTKWINCLTMHTKSLLKYTQQPMEGESRNNILVIDQFDQMERQFKNRRFIRSFKAYIKEVLTKTCLSQLPQIKFIFISNKSYQSISEQFIQAIKEMIKAEAITEIPFLPYSPTDILSILKKKVMEAQRAVGGQPLASDSFLQLTSKREYSRFQDVRKVIGFIYSRFEGSELAKLSQQQKEKTDVRDEDPVAATITDMSQKQKLIFKQLLMGCQKSIEEKTQVLVQWVYKQALKKGVPSHMVDLWMRGWRESGFISLRPFHRQGHQLYRTHSITSHLSFSEYQRLFYS